MEGATTNTRKRVFLAIHEHWIWVCSTPIGLETLVSPMVLPSWVCFVVQHFHTGPSQQTIKKSNLLSSSSSPICLSSGTRPLRWFRSSWVSSFFTNRVWSQSSYPLFLGCILHQLAEAVACLVVLVFWPIALLIEWGSFL